MTGLKTNQYSSTMIGIQIAERYGIDYQTMIANRPQYTTLLMFPLFHVSGLQAVFLTNLLQGGKVVMMPRWSGEEALKLVEREKVTMFPGVPLMYWDMLRAPDVETYDLSSLTNLSVSGQSTPMSLFEAIKNTFPHAIIGCGYGMTETNGAISLLVGEDLINNPTSVGHAVATTEIKLMKDDGSEATQGERGEICVRGATVFGPVNRLASTCPTQLCVCVCARACVRARVCVGGGTGGTLPGHTHPNTLACDRARLRAHTHTRTRAHTRARNHSCADM